MIERIFKRHKVFPIGLDIGHSCIKMIQFSGKAENRRIVAASRVGIDPQINDDAANRRAFVVSSIRRMLVEDGFLGRDVVSFLPNNQLEITSLRLAGADEPELERDLRKEVSHRFGMDPDNDSINYILAGNVRHGDDVKSELILFAAREEKIKDHISMLEEAHLIPAAIDTVPCALFRSFMRTLRRQEDKDRTVVFVDLGSEYTTIVFARGGQINFVKQIPIGGARFNRELASKLGISDIQAEELRIALRRQKALATASAGTGAHAEGSDCLEDMTKGEVADGGIDVCTKQAVVDTTIAIAEELAREISLCSRYYTVTFRGKRIEQAFFAGGQAYEEILLDVLRRQMTVDVELAQPLRGFDLSDVNIERGDSDLLCEWAVAVGLGLRCSDVEPITVEEEDYERN